MLRSTPRPTMGMIVISARVTVMIEMPRLDPLSRRSMDFISPASCTS
ncbi:MAG: hypothetical protein ACE141_09920 [Bryobacteraceae bacterium]